MRRTHRQDDNHGAISRALREAHCVVWDVHNVTGCLDIIAFRGGRAYFLEIKDGAKPASDRRLTEAEQRTVYELASVGIKAHIVTSVEDAMRAVGLIL